MLVLPFLLLLAVPEPPPPLEATDPSTSTTAPTKAPTNAPAKADRWDAPKPDPPPPPRANARDQAAVEPPLGDLVLLASVTGGVAIVSSLAGVLGFAFAGGYGPAFLAFLIPLVATPVTAALMSGRIDAVGRLGGAAAGLSTVVGMGAGAIAGGFGGLLLVSAGSGSGGFTGSTESGIGAVLGAFLGAGLGAATCATATATTAVVFFE